MTAQCRPVCTDVLAAHLPAAEAHLAHVAIGDAILAGARCPVERIGSDTVGAFRRERVGAKRVAWLIHGTGQARSKPACRKRMRTRLTGRGDRTKPRISRHTASARPPGVARPGKRLECDS